MLHPVCLSVCLSCAYDYRTQNQKAVETSNFAHITLDTSNWERKYEVKRSWSLGVKSFRVHIFIKSELIHINPRYIKPRHGNDTCLMLRISSNASDQWNCVILSVFVYLSHTLNSLAAGM